MIDGSITFSVPVSGAASDYSDLKYQIKKAGLLEKQPHFYLGMLVVLMVLLVVCVLILHFVKPFWLQLPNVTLLALITTQFGLLGHAAGHRQLFRKTWINDIVGLIVGNLIVGLSHEWWMERHNKHHSHPNQRGMDPDVFIPVIAFAPEDLQGKGKSLLYLMKYQAYFFFPMLSLALISMQINSIQHIFHKQLHYPVAERLLLFLHFALYFGLVFSCLTFWQALIFILAHYILSGIYMGSIFAPNHKGMPVLEKGSQLDFLHRQVITARNVRAHTLTDLWYGGLNYQIEHHLFPSMAQNKLREAQVIVRAFCQAQAISYYETTMWQSYRETLSSLHEVTAPLRNV